MSSSGVALDEWELGTIPLYKRLTFYLGGPLANLLVTLPFLALLNALKSGVSAYNLFVAPFGQLFAACRQFLGMLSTLLSRPEPLFGVVGIVTNGSDMVRYWNL